MKNLKLNKVWNKKVSGDDKTLPKEEANIAYRLKNFPVTDSYDYMTKADLWLATLAQVSIHFLTLELIQDRTAVILKPASVFKLISENIDTL